MTSAARTGRLISFVGADDSVRPLVPKKETPGRAFLSYSDPIYSSVKCTWLKM